MTAELVLLPVYVFSILGGAFLSVTALWMLSRAARRTPSAVRVRSRQRGF